MIELTQKYIQVNDYVVKSNLPASDYVINPYVGCPHACKYCYACFMKRFSGHREAWGTFLDIKQCDKPISRKRLEGKSVFMSSVTDCYNPYEEKYRVTRKILEQLVDCHCSLGISTKSSLILRDIDILKKCFDVKVSMSVNTLEEEFKNDMDQANSIADRLHTLQLLHENGIHTVLFMSPIFPGITDFKKIIDCSIDFIDEFWFENLNLRGAYKQSILTYIDKKYPQLSDLYHQIYIEKNDKYWDCLSLEIKAYCEEKQVCYTNYFYHKKLVENKKLSEKK